MIYIDKEGYNDFKELLAKEIKKWKQWERGEKYWIKIFLLWKEK